MLYSPFGHIDFISVSALRLEYWKIYIHWHVENTSSITKNINLRFLPGGISSQTHKFKHMKIWAPRIHFLPSSTPSCYPLPHRLPPKSTLPIMRPWKATATQSLFVSDCFLSLCAYVRTVLDPVFLWLRVLVCIVCLCCIDCCWYVGKWGWISVKKEEQKTIHKQRERPKEWKRHKMSHISIWDRRRDLFKLSESSFPFWWMCSMFPSPPYEF